MSAEKGAVRKTSVGKAASSKSGEGKHRGSKETEERVNDELREKREDVVWQAEKKERQEAFERHRKEHEGLIKNSSYKDASAWHAKNFPKYHGRVEDEVDNIVETRFETNSYWGGPLPPLPPHPATPSTPSTPSDDKASLDADWVSIATSGEEEEEEEKKKQKGRSSKKGAKKSSYAKLLEAMGALQKKLEKEKRKNKNTKKEKSPESDASTIKATDYSDDGSDDILASSPSKYVAKPREGSPMDDAE